MFEAQAAYYLNKYLGQYVDGVDPKSLRISVWQGNVVLRDLRVRPEALQDLKLPVTVKAGMLGTLTLKVPWANLGKEPVVVEVDNLYILAAPFKEERNFESEEEVQQFAEEMERMERAAKRRRVESAELDFMEKLNTKAQKKVAATPADEDKGGFLQSYIETIIGNLELRITNVHIRYEDDQTSPGQSFAFGFTLEELSAHTIDDQGNKTFVTAKNMMQVRKAASLKRLAVYFDVSNKLWQEQSDWLQLPSMSWDSVFLPLIHSEIEPGATQSFLLRPVDGSLNYRRRMKGKGQEDEPKQEIGLRLVEIAIHLSRGQYEHVQNLLSVFNLYELSTPHRHLRPPCRPRNAAGARLWWSYAYKALMHRSLGNKMSLHKLKQISETRRMYVKRYVKCLMDGSVGVGGDDAISAMDAELPEWTILVFRQMAHVQVDNAKRKALAEEASRKAARAKTTRWWGWGPTKVDEQLQEQGNGPAEIELSVAPEEWKKLHDLMAVEVEEESGGSANALETLLTVCVNSSAMCLTDEKGQMILEGVLKGTTVVSKTYGQKSSLELAVMSTALLCGEGALLSSGTNQTISTGHDGGNVESLEQAVKLCYTSTPQDRGTNASLMIQLSSGYVTYHDAAIKEVLKFFRPVESVDLSVLQAQATAGMKKATQLAGEQIAVALSETPVFQIELHMDAPKIAIPVQDVGGDQSAVTLIADLGSFGLVTDRVGIQKLLPEHAGKYECLKADMQDVALYLIEGAFQWPEVHSTSSTAKLLDLLEQTAKVIPVLKPFALQSDVQLTRGQQPGLVPAQLNLNVPPIHFYFSAARLAHIMTIVNSLSDLSTAAASGQSVSALTDASSMHGSVSVLAWEGLGGRMPAWRAQYAILNRGSLHFCESETTPEIVKSVWLLADVYISAVPPVLVWGKSNVIAIVPVGVDLKSGVEMAASTILRLGTEEEAQRWRQSLLQEKEQMAAVAGIVEAPSVDTAFLSMLASAEISEEMQVPAPKYIEVTGSIAELAVTILGRPPKDLGDDDGISLPTVEEEVAPASPPDIDVVLNVDTEVPLIVFRVEKGQIDLAVGDFGMDANLQVQSCELEDVLISRPPGVKRYLAQSKLAGILDDTTDRSNSSALARQENYASIGFVRWNPLSKEFQGVDVEVKVEFASMLLEWHRPTVAALMSFGLDLNLANEQEIEGQEETKATQPEAVVQIRSDSSASLVWGDPQRTFFRLSLKLAEVQLDLNYEDAPDCHLASCIFQNFTFNLDVNPAGIQLNSALGNIKVFDGTLPVGHPYHQMCGLRTDTNASLIEVELASHTPAESIHEDRVPTGSSYYSLQTVISAVDVVFFYRFLNEFLVYMAVALAFQPPALVHPVGVLVLVDVKLAAPVVRVPRSSDSDECIFADLGTAEVSNRIVRIPSAEQDTVVNDFHIVLGNMSGTVFRNGHQGANFIEEMGAGVIIDVQILQGSSTTLPSTRACIDIPQVHARIADEDYAFILSAIKNNMSGETKIPAEAFNLTVKVIPEALHLQGRVVNPLERQPLNASFKRTGSLMKGDTIVEASEPHGGANGSGPIQAQVRVGSARLTLLNAQSDGDSTSFGSIGLSNLYCSYKSDGPTNMDIFVCIPSVEVVDLRPDAPEMNAAVLSSGGSADCAQADGEVHAGQGDEKVCCSPSLAVLHYTCKGYEQSMQARFQRPTLMLELSFGLSALEFVVPSVSLGRKVNKEFVTRDILLGADPFTADGDLWLSPETRLLADNPTASDFVFDGNGHRLILPEGITLQEPLPLILVGTGKTLQLKNVQIVNAISLNSIIQLQPGARIFVDDEDGVKKINGDDPSKPSGAHVSHAVRRAEAVLLKQATMKQQAAVPNMSFEVLIVATGVNLQIVDHRKAQSRTDDLEVLRRLLSVQFDLQFDYALNGADYTLDAKLNRLLIETATKLKHTARMDSAQQAGTSTHMEARVLEPCNIKLFVTETSGINQDVRMDITQLVVSITPDLLDFVLHIHNLVLDPVAVASIHKPTVRCSTYKTIWSSFQGSMGLDSMNFNRKGGHDAQGKGWITFWRPQPPVGYCSLGDVVTCGEKQCNDEVIVIALNSGFAAHPTSYTKMWEIGGVTVWMPVPPSGYSALGCLAERGADPPPSQACCCPRSSLLVEAALGECVWLKSPAHLWCVDNAVLSFLVAAEGQHMPLGPFLDLRSPIGVPPLGLSHIPTFSSMFMNAQPKLDHRTSASSQVMESIQTPFDTTVHSYEDFSKRRKQMLMSQSAKNLTVTTVEFKRIWIDKNVKGGQGGGIWRPVAPPGYVITGDCAEVDGLSPPKSAVVLQESSDRDSVTAAGLGKLCERPTGYQCVWKQQVKRGLPLCIWKPMPKPGYVALGYVAEHGDKPPPVGLMRCVRADAVKLAAEQAGRADMEMVLGKSSLFIWRMDPRSGNFVTSASLQARPRQDMWQLKPDEEQKVPLISPHGSPERRMHVAIKTGPTSIQFCDLVRMPIVEFEVQDIAVALTLQNNITQCYTALQACVHSYNSMLSSWEPVLQNAQFLVHVDQNSSPLEAGGIAPGLSVRITAADETVHLTLAYAAINALLEAHQGYLNKHDAQGLSPQQQQRMSIEAAGIPTSVTNMLGLPASLLLDFGDAQEVVEIGCGLCQIVVQPVPQPPQRRVTMCKTVAPTRVLVVEILGGQVQSPGSDGCQHPLQELYCSVRFAGHSPDKRLHQSIRTRSVIAEDGEALRWNEQFLLPLLDTTDPSSPQLAVELWETSGDVGGLLACTGSVNLEDHLLTTPGESNCITVNMGSEDGACCMVLQMLLRVEMSKGSLLRREKLHSSAGERALRLHPSEDWVRIPSSGEQRVHSSSLSAPSLVLPIPVDDGMALETTYSTRMRLEVLRSLCSFVNATQFTLQVRMVEVLGADWEMVREAPQRTDSEPEVFEEEVFENCRFTPLKGWGKEGQGLLPTDRKRYSRKANGAQNSMAFPTVNLPKGWEWDGPWGIDKSGYVDEGGWSYATDFSMMKYPPPKGSQKKGVMDFCRRRRWVRKRRRIRSTKERKPHTGRTIFVGDVLPGTSHPLPLAWCKGHWQLQARPFISNCLFHGWSGAPAADGQGMPLYSLVDGLTALVVCELDGEAQAKAAAAESPCGDDWLGHSYWLSLITEGNLLPTIAGHGQMTDWTVTAHPPLMLHNALPLSGSCIVWEQPTQGAPLQIRQQSHLAAGEFAQFHFADMRKDVRLTFYPDGCDFFEPEPVTISRGYWENAAGVSGQQQLPTDFRISHQGSTTKVLMERSLDIGFSLRGDQGLEKLDPAAAVAVGYPLTLHLYSPLWIVNNTEVALCVAIVRTSKDVVSDPGDEDSEGIDTAIAGKMQDMQVVDILPDSRSPPQPSAQCTVEAYCRDILSYPVHDRRPYHVQIGILGSGWSPPMALSGGLDMGSTGTDRTHTLKTGTSSSHRMLVWAQVPEVKTTYTMVASLDMSGSGNLRTKVLRLEPHVVISNRTGFDLQIAQLPQAIASIGSDEIAAFGNQIDSAAGKTTVCPRLAAGTVEKPLQWQLGCAPAVVCIRPLLTDSTGTVLHQPGWSQPVKIGPAGADDVHVFISGWPYCEPPFLKTPKAAKQADVSTDQALVECVLKISTRRRAPGSLHIVFHGTGVQPAYVIENRTFEPLRFRQQGGTTWHLLPPLSAQGWVLPKLVGASKQVEIQGASDVENLPIRGFSLDEDADVPPISMEEGFLTVEGKPDTGLKLPLTQGHALVEVIDEDDIVSGDTSADILTSIMTWGRRRLVRIHPHHPDSSLRSSKLVGLGLGDEKPFNAAFNVMLNMAGLMVSLVDHRPQELLILYLDGVCIEAATGVGNRGRFSQARVKVNAIQLDDQLPCTTSPVVLHNWDKDGRKRGEEPPILDLMFVKELGRRQRRVHFPSLCANIGSFRIDLHERLVWKVMDMLQLIWHEGSKKSEVAGEQRSSDLIMDIGLLSISDVWINASLAMDPLSRPRYAAASFLSLGLEFANVEDVEFRMRGYERERLTIAQSLFVEQIVAHLRDQFWQIMGGLFEFYFSVGGASKGLAAMGRVLKNVTGVADAKETAKSQSGPSKVDKFHQGLLGGGEALAMGVFKGAAGIVSKPVQGAKQHGVGGFMKGVGKGLLGAAVNPVSGVFEAASKIAEGIDVLTDDIKETFTGSKEEGQVPQRRLPLWIGADRVLRPFDGESAAGQALMNGALRRGGRRSHIASKYDDEAYIGHEVLLDEHVLLWTNKRLLLINIPGVVDWFKNVIPVGATPVKLPEWVLVWDVEWNNVLAINLLNAARAGDLPALVVYSKAKQATFPNFLRAIKCPARKVWKLRESLWRTHAQCAVFSPRMLVYTRSVSCANVAGTSLPPMLLSTDFRLVWRSGGQGRAVSVWRPQGPPGYISLGDVAVIGSSDPSFPIALLLDDSNTVATGGGPPRVALPLGFHLVFRSTHHKLTVWEPIAPDGHCAVGCMVVADIEPPPVGIVRCLRRDLVACTAFFDAPLWKDQSSDIETMVSSLWLKDQNPLSTFWAVRGLDRPRHSLSLVPKPQVLRNDAP